MHSLLGENSRTIEPVIAIIPSESASIFFLYDEVCKFCKSQYSARLIFMLVKFSIATENELCSIQIFRHTETTKTTIPSS